MERAHTPMRLVASLLAAVITLAALAATGAVWIPQPAIFPFATNGEQFAYLFALHFAGGLIAFIIVLLLADRGEAVSSPLTAAFVANLLPASVGLAGAGFFGNWAAVAIAVVSASLVGTLTFWLVLRAFDRSSGPRHS